MRPHLSAVLVATLFAAGCGEVSPKGASPTPAPADTLSTGSIRPRMASRVAASIFSLVTCRSSCLAIPARPFSAAARLTSASSTWKPAAADTCAIPAPICPAPMTPTVSMPLSRSLTTL